MSFLDSCKECTDILRKNASQEIYHSYILSFSFFPNKWQFKDFSYSVVNAVELEKCRIEYFFIVQCTQAPISN